MYWLISCFNVFWYLILFYISLVTLIDRMLIMKTVQNSQSGLEKRRETEAYIRGLQGVQPPPPPLWITKFYMVHVFFKPERVLEFLCVKASWIFKNKENCLGSYFCSVCLIPNGTFKPHCSNVSVSQINNVESFVEITKMF